MPKEYKISPDDEYLDPEDTLADSLSGLSKIERPMPGSFFKTVIIFFIIIFGFFLIKIIDLQVISGNKFKEIALRNVTLNYFIPAPRGTIYDRQGKELAYDIPDFKLLIVSRYVPKEKQEFTQFIKDLSIVSGKPLEEIEEILERQKNKALISLEENMGKSRAIQVSQLELPGIYVVPMPKRVYANGQVFSHIIGYTNKVSPSDLNDSHYKLQDRIGRIGIEGFYEKTLRGAHDIVYFLQESSQDNFQKGKSGNSLVLNIDTEIQERLYSDLSRILKSYGLKRGAAIVQNPYNGAVLAMVSFPSFDNNVFQDNLTIQEAEYIFEDVNKPLFNRVISGQYSPGSTIKPFLALAGLKEGIINPDTTITDTKGYITIPNQFNPDIVYIFRDWKIQGRVNLKKALAQSSDIYFYSLGGGYGKIKGLGIDKIVSYLKDFVVDRVLGIDLLGERTGFIPTPSWKMENRGERWYTGDTYNISIGQGDLLVTPLWLNTYISAIANGGTLYKPSIVSKVVDSDKNIIEVLKKEQVTNVNFDISILREVREGMREVVISGTGRLLANLPVPVAAKTGTSEVIKGKSSNSFITVYGPYQDPEITLTILVENIKNDQQGVALQAARSFLSWYFKKDVIPIEVD